jgi:WD40 repeat protein
MFTWVENEIITINPGKESKKVRDASNQTKQPSTRNACHQSVKVKSVSTTVETTTTFPDNPDQITGLISFLNGVYPKVSAQLEMNIRLAKKFRQVAKSTLVREMGLSYPRHTLVSVTSFDHRILAAYEVDDKESVLCLWNLNLNQISETEPFKIIHAPGHIRALCYLKTQPTIVCAGFKNGDLRILDLETNEWSKLYKGHHQTVSHIYWDKSTLISCAQDSSFCAWRYSKSKNKLELKNLFVTRKNFGCPMHLTVEMDKFLLVSFNANILAVFEFSDQKVAVHGTYNDAGILQQKRIFRNMFDAPLMTIASHSLGYLPSLDTLLTLPEQQKIQLKGTFAHEMERIMKFDRYLDTDRTDRIGLVSGNEITIFSSG